MIPIYEPYLVGNEKRYVNECLNSTWISSKGSFIDKFEIGIKEYVGREFASACSNGTTALDLVFKGLGIGIGDEVITSAFTYVASTNAIIANSATPVFIDINPKNWNLDVDLIESKITSKTKAILIANIYGYLPNIEKLNAICKKHSIILIEDAAESLGSSYKNIKSGSFGQVSTLSFYGNKTITTGEGGMILTDDQDLHHKIEQLKNQGNSTSRRYYHDILGYNYRMTNIQAAIGCAQLENIDIILQLKENIYWHYFNKLKDVVEFQVFNSSNQMPSFWIIAILFRNTDIKNKIEIKLKENKIETRPLFYPIDELPFYNKCVDLNITKSLHERGLCLPSFPGLSSNNLDLITNTILNEF